MSRAELTIPATCIFWRTEDGWRGECVELAAQSVGCDLAETRTRLVAECYRVSELALDHGQLPVRHPDEVSDEARKHLAAVLEDGALVPQQDLGEGSFRHVLMNFDIALQRTLPDPSDDILGELRFIFIRIGHLWVAQCLEHDIGGEGESTEAAAVAAVDAIMTQLAMDRVLGRPPLSGSPNAPERYWRLYERGAPIDVDRQDIEGKFRVAQAA